MSDLAYLETDPPKRSQQEHYRDILREHFKRKISHVSDDFEQAQDYGRNLMRAGGDITDEVNELEATANGLLLAVLLLKRESERRKETPTQYWQSAE